MGTKSRRDDTKVFARAITTRAERTLPSTSSELALSLSKGQALSAAFDVDFDLRPTTIPTGGAPFLASFARSGDFRSHPARPWKSGASAPRKRALGWRSASALR